MIDKEFIFTDHAETQWKARFYNLNRKDELSNIIYCTKDETHSLKNSPSFKKIKKERRSHYYFYKSKNNVYFVTESKHQARTDTFANVVVTVIDILNEDTSKITDSFKKQMIIAEYNLIQTTTFSEYRFKKESEFGALERVIVKANKKNLFEKQLDLDFFIENNFNAYIASSSISRLNTTNNKMNSLKALLLKLKEDSLKGNYLQDRNFLIEQVLILDKNIISQPASLFDLENEVLDSYYILLIEDLLELKLEVLSFIENKETSINHEDYRLHMKAFSFYKENEEKSNKIKLMLIYYADYISYYHSNEFKLIEDFNKSLEKNKIEMYRYDFYSLLAVLLHSETKQKTIEKLNKYKDFYEVVYAHMIQNELTEIKLK